MEWDDKDAVEVEKTPPHHVWVLISKYYSDNFPSCCSNLEVKEILKWSDIGTLLGHVHNPQCLHNIRGLLEWTILGYILWYNFFLTSLQPVFPWLQASLHPRRKQTTTHRVHRKMNPKNPFKMRLLQPQISTPNSLPHSPLIPRLLPICMALLHQIDVCMPISAKHRILSPNLTHPESVSAKLFRHIDGP